MHTGQLSTYHCFLSSGVERMVCTIRAPCTGGLEYIGRTRILICDIARFASSSDEQTRVNAPARSPELFCQQTMVNASAHLPEMSCQVYTFK